MRTSEHEPTSGGGLEPLGDPDEKAGDFAEEHDQFVVEDADDGEQESPSRYGAGLDSEGPP
ncbi:hypothetical protein [Actinoplanes sp. NPDC026623]|uniref:hypothetical protein n=1 Tax=Actinoplanes sp. NPDC026623 TaxID=3155610 RepID=UPI0033D4538B